MNCDIMMAFTKGVRGECYVLMERHGTLEWNYNPYTIDDIYSEHFTYIPQNGKTIDEVWADNMEPLCEIIYAHKMSLDRDKNFAMVILETEYSLLLRVGDAHFRYDKEDIDYEIVYEQENLKYIDEL